LVYGLIQGLPAESIKKNLLQPAGILTKNVICESFRLNMGTFFQKIFCLDCSPAHGPGRLSLTGAWKHQSTIHAFAADV